MSEDLTNSPIFGGKKKKPFLKKGDWPELIESPRTDAAVMRGARAIVMESEQLERELNKANALVTVLTRDGTLNSGSFRWMAEKVLEHSDRDSDYMSLASRELERVADAIDLITGNSR